jgi:uncharacterized protein YfaS (alpha-2-macroglobulin family)
MGIVIIAFAIGLGSTIAIFAFTGPTLNPVSLVDRSATSVSEKTFTEHVGNLTDKVTMLEQKLKGIDDIQHALSTMEGNIQSMESSVGKLQTSVQDQSSDLDSELNLLKTQVKIVAGQVGDLESKIDKLSLGATAFSAELGRTEYRAGDTVTITGSGLPNKPVKVTLLGIDRLILSEGSTITDSNGVFTFTTQLSKSYALGDYAIKFSQEGKVIERSFRIIGDTQSSSGTLTLQVDKSQYVRGERVLISGKTVANAFVDIDILDSSSVQLVRTATKADSSGNYRLDYTLSSDAKFGTYTVKVTSLDRQTSITFTVGNSSTPSPTGSLTITTDKHDYSKGSLVKITGKATPNGKVTVLVQPKSGDEIVLTATATDTGNYIVLLSIRSDASAGTWTLTAREGSDTAVTQITVI